MELYAMLASPLLYSPGGPVNLKDLLEFN
jgi:hypothetical protein